MRHNSRNHWFCNKANRKIAGVCSGIAAGHDFNVTAVRLAAVLMLFTFPTMVLFAYVLAALLLPSRYII